MRSLVLTLAIGAVLAMPQDAAIAQRVSDAVGPPHPSPSMFPRLDDGAVTPSFRDPAEEEAGRPGPARCARRRCNRAGGLHRSRRSLRELRVPR